MVELQRELNLNLTVKLEPANKYDWAHWAATAIIIGTEFVFHGSSSQSATAARLDALRKLCEFVARTEQAEGTAQ